MIARRIVGQMLPKLGFGEQFPTSIRMTRGCLTAQHCHRAQATRSIHVLLPLIILVEAAYFLFLRRSHYDYEAKLIFSREARFDFVTPSNRVSRATGAICKGYRRRTSRTSTGVARRAFADVISHEAIIEQLVEQHQSRHSTRRPLAPRPWLISRSDEGGLFALGPSDVRHRNQFEPGGGPFQQPCLSRPPRVIPITLKIRFRCEADDVHLHRAVGVSKPTLQTSVELGQERQHRILVGPEVRDAVRGYPGDERKRDGDGLMGHRRLPAAPLP